MSYKQDAEENTKTYKVTSLHIYEQTNPKLTLRRVVEACRQTIQ